MTKLSDVQIAAFVDKAWSPALAGDISTGVAIALAESGGNTVAINRSNNDGSVDYGLFQINSVHANRFRLVKYGSSNLWDQRLTPDANSQMAYRVFSNSGRSWWPWTVYRTGAYKQHLTRAKKAVAELNATKGGWKEILKDLVIGSVDPNQGIAGGAPGGTNSITDALRKLDVLFDPKNWARVGLILGGFALTVIVLFQLVKNTQAYKNLESGVKMAVTKGLVK